MWWVFQLCSIKCIWHRLHLHKCQWVVWFVSTLHYKSKVKSVKSFAFWCWLGIQCAARITRHRFFLICNATSICSNMFQDLLSTKYWKQGSNKSAVRKGFSRLLDARSVIVSDFKSPGALFGEPGIHFISGISRSLSSRCYLMLIKYSINRKVRAPTSRSSGIATRCRRSK